MPNEILLAGSLVLIFGAVLAAFRAFGRAGLFCMSAVCTIFANIEVVLLVNAFGMEQTLGNVLFAATFLITDILSECYGKKDAQRAVWLGVFSSAFFLLLSQSWLLYTPSENDVAASAFAQIFGNTPRLMLASLAVYAVCQFFDVWLYHRWWRFTTRLTGDGTRLLWVRNATTFVSQLVNTGLFTFLAFWGVYDVGTLLQICLSSYAVFIVTTVCDTPAIYLARSMDRKHRLAERDRAGEAAQA